MCVGPCILPFPLLTQNVLANDPAALYQLDLAVQHLCRLKVTWQPKIAPIPCPKALPPSWGPSEQQLQDVAAYAVTADWVVVDDQSDGGDINFSAQEECADELGTERADSAGYLAGELLDSVEAADLSEAYRDEMDLYLYLDRAALDIGDSRASSPLKRRRGE